MDNAVKKVGGEVYEEKDHQDCMILSNSFLFSVGLLFLKNANDDDSWLFIILSLFPFLFCLFIDGLYSWLCHGGFSDKDERKVCHFIPSGGGLESIAILMADMGAK